MGQAQPQKPAIRNTRSLRSETIFRALGLQPIFLLLQDLRRTPVQEEKSVAFVQAWWPVTCASLLHFPGLIAVVIVSYLSWRGYYIGGELSGKTGQNSLKLFALQSTAKYLDQSISISLYVMVFRFVRQELAFGEGIPFGALTSALRVTQISFLWSSEFVATCSTAFGQKGKKVLLVTLLAVSGWLSFFIGPSMATALIPTLADWPAGGTQLWLNRTSDEIWPSHLTARSIPVFSCASDVGLDCLSSIWSALSTAFFPYWPEVGPNSEMVMEMVESVRIPGRKSVRSLSLSPRGPFLFSPDLTCATVQQATVADAVAEARSLWFRANQQACVDKSGFCFYNDIIWSIEAMQPVTFVRCNIKTANTEPQYPLLGPSFNEYTTIENKNETGEPRHWLLTKTSNGNSSDILWVDLDDSVFGENAVGALVGIASATEAPNDYTSFACTIDARWAKVQTTASFLNGPHIISGKPDHWLNYDQLQRNEDSANWRKVKLDPHWLQIVNPVLQGQTETAFNKFLSTLPSRQDISKVEASNNAIEAMLAAVIAHTMSLTGNDATIQGTLKTGSNGVKWQHELLPINAVFGHGGTAFAVDAQAQDPTHSTMLQFLASVNGYGYGISTANILASIVLWLYVTIVLYHFFTLDPVFSNSWDTLSGVVALAMNSTPPADGILQNTGAGISTLKPLQQPVRIVVRDGERLELRFGTSPVMKEERVHMNTAYG